MCIFVYPNNCELLTHDWCLIHLSLSFVLAQCREIPAECIKANASSLVSHRYSHDGTEASSTTVIFCPHIPVVSWSFQNNKPNTNARQARMLGCVSKRAKTSSILWKADFKHIHLRAGLRILWVWQFIINSPLSVWKLNYIQNTKTTWCKACCLWEEKAALQGRECENSSRWRLQGELSGQHTTEPTTWEKKPWKPSRKGIFVFSKTDSESAKMWKWRPWRGLGELLP